MQTGRLSYCSEFVGLGALWFGVRLAIANPANIKARCADRNSTSTPPVGGFTLRGHGACSVLFSASLIFLTSTHFHFFGGGVARAERVLTSSQRAHIATFIAVLVSPKRSYEQKDEIAESRLHTKEQFAEFGRKKCISTYSNLYIIFGFCTKLLLNFGKTWKPQWLSERKTPLFGKMSLESGIQRTLAEFQRNSVTCSGIHFPASFSSLHIVYCFNITCHFLDEEQNLPAEISTAHIRAPVFSRNYMLSASPDATRQVGLASAFDEN